MDGGDAAALAGTLQAQAVGAPAQLVGQHDTLVGQAVGIDLAYKAPVDEHIEIAGARAAHVDSYSPTGKVGLCIDARPVKPHVAVISMLDTPCISYALGKQAAVVYPLCRSLERKRQETQYQKMFTHDVSFYL